MLSRRNPGKSRTPRSADLPQRRRRPDAVRAFLAEFEELESRTLLTTITSNQSAGILTGLQAVETFGATLITTGPLAKPLPVINQSLGQVLDAHQAVAQGLVQEAEAYLNQQGITPTVEGLLADLNATTTQAVSGVTYTTTTTATATTNPQANALTFAVGLDVTATSSPTISLGANAAAMGLSASASATVTATLDLNFAFTVDNNSDFSLTFNTTTPASLGATVTATGNLGLTAPNPGQGGASAGISATLDHFNFNPSASLTFLNPNGDGTLTAAQLSASDLSNVVALTPYGSLDAELTASAGLPGLGSLGSTDISLEDDDVFNGAAPDVSVSVALSQAMQDKITAAFNQLASYGSQLTTNSTLSAVLNSQIPVLDMSVNDLLARSGAAASASGLSASDFLQLGSAVTSYFTSCASSGTSPTVDGLFSALSAQALALVGSSATGGLASGPFSFSGGLDPQTEALTFNVGLDMSRDLSDLPIDLGTGASDLGFSLNGSADLDASVNFDLNATLGLNLSSFLSNPSNGFSESDAYVQLNNLSAGAHVGATNLNFGATMGIVQAGVTGGTAGLDATAVVSVQKPGGSNTITLADLDPNSQSYVPLSSLIHLTTPTTDSQNNPLNDLNITLPVAVSVGGFQAPTGSSAPTISLTDSNVFTTAPTFATQNFSDLLNFRNITPTQLLTLIGQVGTFLNQYRNSPVFGVEIPLTNGTTLGSVLDLGTTFDNKLLNGLENSQATLAGASDVAANFSLSSPATFQLSVDGGAPLTVTVPATTGNATRTINDLVNDVQEAINTALAGSGLGGSVTVGSSGQQLTLTRTVPGTSDSASLAVSSPNASASSALGLAAGTSGASQTVAAFSTAQDLANLLANELGIPANIVNLQFDDTTKSLTFHVHFTDTYAPVSVPLNFDLPLGDLGSITTTSTGSLSAGVTLDFTFGVALNHTDDPSLSGQVSTPSATGPIAGTATFQITPPNGGSPVMVTLPANASYTSIVSIASPPDLDDTTTLVGLINQAINATSLKGQVQADSNGSSIFFTPLAPNSSGQLAGDATYYVTLGSNPAVSVEVPASVTTDNTAIVDTGSPPNLSLQTTFIGDVNNEIATTSLAGLVQAQWVNGALTFVKIGSEAGTSDALSFTERVINAQVAATAPILSNGAVNPAFSQLALPGDGDLGAGTSFTIDDGSDGPIAVTVPASAMANNTAMANSANPFDPTTLVGDLNLALQAAGLLSYTTDNNGNFAAFTGKVYAQADGNVIQFQAVDQAGVYSLTLSNLAANDPLATILGFTNGQTAKGSVGDIFISTTPLITATADLTVTNLAASADFGYVQLGTTGGSANADATFSVGFNDPANPSAATVSLSTLSSEFGQGDFTEIVNTSLTGSAGFTLGNVTVSGLGTSFSLPTGGNDAVSVQLPNLFLPGTSFDFGSTGVLSGDARFDVTVGTNAPVSVTVAQTATANDTSLNDLAAQFQAALAAAGLGSSVTATVDNGLIEFVPVAQGISVSVSNVSVIAVPALDMLKNFEHLNLASVVAGLQTASSVLDAASSSGGNFSFLNANIPLINESVTQLVDSAASLGTKLQAMSQDPDDTLQLLQDDLADALGIDPSLVTLTYDQSNPAHPALSVEIKYDTTYSNQTAIDLDLASLAALAGTGSTASNLAQLTSLVDAAGSAKLQVQAYADLDLHFGIDLTNPLEPRPFLYDGSSGPGLDGTGVTLGVKINGTDMNFQATLGPVGVYVQGGTASLTSAQTGGDGYAHFAVNLYDADGSGRYYLDSTSAIEGVPGDLRVTVDGKANITLPIYAPTNTSPLGGAGNNDLSISINSLQSLLSGQGTAGTVTIVSPSFSSLIPTSAASLLRNPSVLINGLNTALGALQTALGSELDSKSLPLVGSNLQEGAQFIASFRQNVLNTISNELAEAPNGDPTEIVTQALNDALGPNGANLLVGLATETEPTIGTSQAIQYNMHLAGTEETSVPFSLGLSSVGLSLTGTVYLSLHWDFYLEFGLSTSQGLYVVTNPTDPANGTTPEPVFKVTATASLAPPGVTNPTPFTATGKLGFLDVTATDGYTDSNNVTHNSGITAGFTLGAKDYPTATAPELLTATDLLNPGTVLSGLGFDASASADVDLALTLGFGQSDMFPSFNTDLTVGWGIQVGDTATVSGVTGVDANHPTVPLVTFHDVNMNLGSFLSNFVDPIAQDIKKYLDPIKPIIDILTTPLPVISDLAGHSVDLEDLASLFGYGQFKTFTDAFNAIYSIVNSIPATGNAVIHFGDYSFGGAPTTSDPNPTDLSTATSLPASPDVPAEPANWTPQTQIGSDFGSGSSTATFASGLDHEVSGDYKLVFPLLSSQAPTVIMGLLSGKPVDLFEFDMTELKLGFSYRQIFPIAGPLAATLGGSISADLHFAFGYDTTGIIEVQNDTDKSPAEITKDLLDGFYIVSNDGPNITLNGDIVAGAALSVAIATGGVEGGVFAQITASLRDPNNDGKLRIDEIANEVDPPGGPINPLNLFNIVGTLTFQLYAYVDAGPFHYSKQIVSPITLLSFDNIDPDPVLASESTDPNTGLNTLTLNTGKDASLRSYGDTSDDNEYFKVTDDGPGNLGGRNVEVEMYHDAALTDPVVGSDGSPVIDKYTSISSIDADMGAGDNVLDMSTVTIPVTVTAGDGRNIITTGTGAADVTVGNGTNTIDLGGSTNTVNLGTGSNTIVPPSGAQDTVTVSGAYGYAFTAGAVPTLSTTDGSGSPLGTDNFGVTPVALTLTGAVGNDTFDVSQWQGSGLTLVGPSGSSAAVEATDNSDFTLSDTSLTRTGAGWSSTVALSGVTQANLTATGYHTFNVSGWSGSGDLVGGTGGTGAANTFDVTATRDALPNLSVTGTGGADVLNLTLTGDPNAGTNATEVTTAGVPTVNFTNASDSSSNSSVNWVLTGGVLSAGGRAVLGTGGASQTNITLGANPETFYLEDVVNPTSVVAGGSGAFYIQKLAYATSIDSRSAVGTTTFQVGDTNNPLANITAGLTLLGKATDSATFDDAANTHVSTDSVAGYMATGELDALSGQGAVVGELRGLGMAAKSEQTADLTGYIKFDTMPITLDLGVGGNNFTVNDTNVVTTLYGQTTGTVGANTITIDAAHAAVTVDGSGINQDTLVVNRASDTASYTAGALSATVLSGVGLSPITYNRVGTLDLDLGSGTDTLNVTTTMHGTTTNPDTTVINTGAGNDQINVYSVGDSTRIQGQTGLDTVTLKFGTNLSLKESPPYQKQFANLQLSVQELVLSDADMTQSTNWQFTSGAFLLKGNSVANAVVNTAGANVVALIGMPQDQDTLLVSNTGSGDQTATVSATGIVLDQGASVLSNSQFLNGASVGYTTTVDGLTGATAVVTGPNGFVYVASHAENTIAVFKTVPFTDQLIYIQTVVYQASNQATWPLNGVDTLTLSPDGSYLFAGGANALGAFPINATTGLLGTPNTAQEAINTPAAVTSLAVAAVVSPTFLSLYAAMPSTNGGTSHIYDYNFFKSTGNIILNTIVSVTVGGFQNLKVSPDGTTVYALGAAAGGGGVFDTFSRDTSDGTLSENGPDIITPANSTDNGINESLQFTTNARAMAVDPSGNLAFVLNTPTSGAGSLSVFRRDPATGLFTALIQTINDDGTYGLTGADELLVSPDEQHVYVVGGTINYQGVIVHEYVSVFDLNEFSSEPLSLNVLLGNGDGPGNLTFDGMQSGAVSDDGTYLYLTAHAGIYVDEYKWVNGSLTYLAQLEGTSNTHDDPLASIAASDDGKSLYVASSDFASVNQINLTNGYGSPANSSTNYMLNGYSVSTSPNAVAVSADGTAVYVALTNGSLVSYVRNTTSGNLSSMRVTAGGSGNGTVALTVSPATGDVYLVSSGGNSATSIAVFSPATAASAPTLLTTISSSNGNTPFSKMTIPAFNEDGSYYVASYNGTSGVALMRNDTTAFQMNSNQGGALLDGASDLVVGPEYYGTDEHDVYVTTPTGSAGGTGGLTVLEPIDPNEPDDMYVAAQWLVNGVTFNDGSVATGLNGAVASAISPDGNFLYVLSNQGVSAFYRSQYGLVEGELQFTTLSGTSGVAGATGLTISPDGNWLEVLGSTNNVLVRFSRDNTATDANYGKLTQQQTLVDGTITTPPTGLASVNVSPDGKFAYALAPGQGGLEVFGRNPTTGALTAVPIEVLFDGETLTPLSSGASPSVITSTLNAGLVGATGLAISPDGTRVYVVSPEENSLAVFSRNTTTGLLTFLEIHHEGDSVEVPGTTSLTTVRGLQGATSVAVSPNSVVVVVSGSSDAGVAIFAANEGGGAVGYFGTDSTYGTSSDGMAFSVSGQFLYLANGPQNTVGVYNVATDQDGFLSMTPVGEVSTAPAISSTIDGAALAVSPDGASLYFADPSQSDLAAFTLNTTTGMPTLRQVVNEGADGVLGLGGADAVAVSSDSQYVFVAGGSENALAVFGLDQTAGTANYDQLAFLQALSNGAGTAAGLGGVNSVVARADGTVTVASRTGTAGTTGGLAVYAIAANVPPPTQYTLGYSALQGLTLTTGSGDDHISVTGTVAGITTTINTGNGGDSVDVQSLGAAGKTGDPTRLDVSFGAIGQDDLDLWSTTATAITRIDANGQGGQINVWATGTGDMTRVDTYSASQVVQVEGAGLASNVTLYGSQNTLNFDSGDRLYQTLDQSGNNTFDTPIVPQGSIGTISTPTTYLVHYYSMAAVTVIGPPTASILSSPSVSEGSPVTLSAAGNLNPVTYAWQVQVNGQYVSAAYGQNPTLTWADLVQLGAGIHGTYPVRLVVTDNAHGYVASMSGSFTVTKANPTVGISGSGSATTLNPYTLTLSDSRPGTETTTSWAVNWGDGTGNTPDVVTYTGDPSSVTHQYTAAGNDTITASIIDSDGMSYNASGPVNVVVTNPLKANAGGPYAVTEGNGLTLSSSLTNTGGLANLSYTWSVGLNTLATTANPTVTWAQLLAAGVRTSSFLQQIQLTVSGSGHTSTAPANLTVTAVSAAPVISGPSDVNQDATYTLDLASTPIDSSDAVKTWQIHWGDGSVSTVSGSATTATHTYTSGPNGYVISATETDQNASYTVPNTVSVDVHHVAPTLSIAGPSGANNTVAAGITFPLTLSATTTAHAPILSWTINWGDGSAAQVVSGSPSQVTHIYANGSPDYVISASANDSVGTYDAAHVVSVQVTSLAPANVTLSAPASVVEGSSLNLSGSFSDSQPGAHSVVVTWGDGTTSAPIPLASGVTTFQASHTYADVDDVPAPGIAPISVTVTNTTSQLQGIAQTTVSVLDSPPAGVTVTPTSTEITEGSSVGLTGSFTAAGGPDPHTVDINWGDGTADTILDLAAGVLTFATTTPHTYANNLADNAPYPVTVTVSDPYGGQGVGGTSVKVDNAPPSGLFVTPSLARIGVGQFVTLGGQFADPGVDDAHTVRVDWGDNTPDSTFNLAPGVTSFGGGSVSHRYLIASSAQPNDQFPVTVTVTDDSNASVSAGTAIEVDDTQTALAVASAGGIYGGTTSLSATLTGFSGPIASQTVTFALNGVTVGTAVTDSNGVATYSGVNLGALDAGFYAGAVQASVAASANYQAASGTGDLLISQASATVTAASQTMTYGSAVPAPTYTVTGLIPSLPGTVTGTPALNDTATSSSTVAGGPYAITIGLGTLASTDYALTLVSGTMTVTAANPAVSVSDAGGAYDGTTYPATATVTGVTGGAQASLEGVTPTLTYYAGTTATGSPLSGAPTAAGTYTVVANFAGSADYTSASSSPLTFTIGQATPKVSVSDAGGTYNGSSYPASETITGVSGPATSLEGVTPTFTYYLGSTPTGTPLSGAPSVAGTYTVVASFVGSADYASASSAPLTFTIGQATPKVSVSDAGGTFNGSPYAAAETVTGVSGAPSGSLEGVTPNLTYYAGTTATGTPLSGAPSVAGTYTVVANFAGSTDYASAASVPLTFTIGQAVATVSVSDAGGAYSGSSYPASAAVTGVSGGATSSLEGIIPTLAYYAGTSATGTPLAGAPTAAGTYTVVASFAGSADYAPATSKPVTFTIGKAAPKVSVSDAGGTFSGSAYPASATVTGVSGGPAGSLEGVAPTLTYYAGTTATGTPLLGAPTSSGTYTVVASFAGSADYASAASVPLTFTIGKATATVTAADGGGTFDGAPYAASEAVTGVSGSPAATLEGVTPTLSYYAGTTAIGTPLAGAPTSAGTYTVVASFAGSADYAPATSKPVTFTIGKATPTVAVSDAGGIYSGSAFAASETVTGVSGAAASLEGVTPTLAYYAGTTATGTPLAGAPTLAGTYTVVASFSGSADYGTAVSVPVTFTIGKAAPKVSVSDAGGTYSGSAFPASETVTGVSGGPASSLEGVAPTLTYYAGTSATGTPLAGAPTTPGTYTVLGSFAGSSDYAPASSQATFAIAKHATTNVVTLSNPTAAVGQSLTYTATVSGGLAAPYLPTGTVQFQVNGANVGAPVALGSGGTASYTTTATAGGTFSVTAIYSGDGDFLSATSAPASQVVLKTGVTVSGTTLYIVGANTSDSVQIRPVGCMADGSTGLSVAATLNGVWAQNTYNQAFTAIVFYGFGGNDNFQLASTLTLATTVIEGNGNNYIQTGGGNDTYTLGTGNNQIFSGNGSKTITAQDPAGSTQYFQLGSGTHTLTLGAGNDQVFTGDGPNTVTAGNGNDYVSFGNGTVSVTLGNGNDSVVAGTGTATVTLGNGNENVQVGDGNLTLKAGSGNNYVHAGAGADAVTMGSGNDNVQLGGGADVVTLGDGNDYVSLGGGNDALTVGNGNDNLQLGSGNNVIVEGNGNDYVNAGNGSNLVVGGLGQHQIVLGNGNNVLIDGSATISSAVPGDSLLAILNAWKGGASATSLRSRLNVTFNTTKANILTAGSGRNWFLYANAKDSVNAKSTDSVSRS